VKAITQLRVGQIAALVAIICFIPALFTTIINYISKQEINLFLIDTIIPLIIFPFYFFALFKKKLSLAHWTYYACLIYFIWILLVQIILYGWFTKKSGEGLDIYIVLITLIAIVAVILVRIPFKMGIRGLYRLLNS